MSSAVADKLLPDYSWIARSFRRGNCVPFLGAGASIGAGFPSGSELAACLVTESGYPDEHGRDNLAMLASYYVHAKTDSNDLRDLLRTKLKMESAPLKLHHLLVNVARPQLIVTTNYDDLLERATQARDSWTIVDRGQTGRVSCRPPEGEKWQDIDAMQLDTLVPDDARILYKMHGSFDRENAKNDFFLITEEDYVDFLGRPVEQQIPTFLTQKMREQNFLFLGYGLRDWNVRVMLERLKRARSSTKVIKSWAIVQGASEAERILALAHNVLLYNIELADFTAQLEIELQKPEE